MVPHSLHKCFKWNKFVILIPFVNTHIDKGSDELIEEACEGKSLDKPLGASLGATVNGDIQGNDGIPIAV